MWETCSFINPLTSRFLLNSIIVFIHLETTKIGLVSMTQTRDTGSFVAFACVCVCLGWCGTHKWGDSLLGLQQLWPTLGQQPWYQWARTKWMKGGSQGDIPIHPLPSGRTYPASLGFLSFLVFNAQPHPPPLPSSLCRYGFRWILSYIAFAHMALLMLEMLGQLPHSFLNPQ